MTLTVLTFNTSPDADDEGDSRRKDKRQSRGRPFGHSLERAGTEPIVAHLGNLAGASGSGSGSPHSYPPRHPRRPADEDEEAPGRH